jgi:type II secretion system protein H
MWRSLSREGGFSLVEVSVALVILGLTLVVGFPAINRLMGTQDALGAAENVAAHLRLARQKAVAEGFPMIVTWDADAKTYEITRDDNQDDIAAGDEPTVGPFSLPTHVTWETPLVGGFTGTQIILRPDGSASQSGSVLFQEKGTTVRLTMLAPTGRVRVRAE